MKVKEAMSGPAVEVSAEESCQRAAERMRGEDTGMLVVTNLGVVEGVITDRDLVTRCMAIGADASAQRVTMFIPQAKPNSPVLAGVNSTAVFLKAGSDRLIWKSGKTTREVQSLPS